MEASRAHLSRLENLKGTLMHESAFTNMAVMGWLQLQVSSWTAVSC